MKETRSRRIKTDGRPGAENDLHVFQQLPRKPFISVLVAAQTKLNILYLGLSTADAVNTYMDKEGLGFDSGRL